MRIRILFLIKVMGVCDHGLKTLQASIVSVHGPQRLYFEPVKLLKFDFNADPEPVFQSNADPYPASKNYADQSADPDPQTWD
jgi:hypothetical protein